MYSAARTTGSRPDLRIRAVTADAFDRDVDGGGRRHGRAGGDADHAGWMAVAVVQANDHRGASEPLVQVVGEHGFRSVDGLFRRLADEHEGAVPARFGRGHRARDADQYGRVDVVSAGLHDADGFAGLVFGGDVTGIGQARLLDDRQAVHIRAHHERWAGAVLQDADQAVRVRSIGINADVVGHGIACFFQLGGEQGRGLDLVVRKLGMRVDLLVGVDERSVLRENSGNKQGQQGSSDEQKRLHGDPGKRGIP